MTPEELARLAGEMGELLKDTPDRLVCHPGVAQRLMEDMPEVQPSLPGTLAGFGIPVIADPSLKEHEWKLFRGDRLLRHCFPNPFREGELIIYTPPDFTVTRWLCSRQRCSG